MSLPLKCDNCGSSRVYSPDGGSTYYCTSCGHIHTYEPVDSDLLDAEMGYDSSDE